MLLILQLQKIVMTGRELREIQSRLNEIRSLYKQGDKSAVKEYKKIAKSLDVNVTYLMMEF